MHDSGDAQANAERLRSGARAKGFECPEILRVFATEDVALAIDQRYAEVRGARRIPAIFDFRNVHHLAGNL